MPAKVSVKMRPMVTAGFANEVELVNQYAAPMYDPHGRGNAERPTGSGEGEDHQDQPSRGDDLTQQVTACHPVGLRDCRRHLEHDVGQHGPCDRSEALGRDEQDDS